MQAYAQKRERDIILSVIREVMHAHAREREKAKAVCHGSALSLKLARERRREKEREFCHLYKSSLSVIVTVVT